MVRLKVSEKNVLCFNLGSVTLVVSLLAIGENIIKVNSTSRDDHFRRKDFDDNLVNHFVEEFKRKNKKGISISRNSESFKKLKTDCKRARRTLSSTSNSNKTEMEIKISHEGIHFRSTITLSLFEKLNKDLFKKCIKRVDKCLSEAKMDKSSVDNAVLAGGSSGIPMLQQLLVEHFNGKRKICKNIKPAEAVAYGKKFQAALAIGAPADKLEDLVILDLNPNSVDELKITGSSSLQDLPRKAAHDTHPGHKLRLINHESLIKCNGCKMPAFGKIYRCELCNFNLHIKCMFTKPTAKHECVGSSTFEYLKKLPCDCNDRECHRFCEVCAKPVKGFVYHCRKNGVNFHPCCFDLRSKLRIDDVEFQLSKEMLSAKCIFCKDKRLRGSVVGNSGWSYVSTNEGLQCHASCWIEMLLEKLASEDYCKDNGGRPVVPQGLKLPVKTWWKHIKGLGKGKVFKIATTLFHALVSILTGDPINFIAAVAGLIMSG